VFTEATSSLLNQSVGAIMRPVGRLAAGASLETAAARLREDSGTLVAVVDRDLLVGAVTERLLAFALADGASPTDPVEAFMFEAPTLPPYATAAEALRKFADEGIEAILVVDDLGHLLGILSPSDLYPKRAAAIRPAMIGGMATPFGVFLTTGTVRAGVGDLALMSTGASLFGMLIASQIAGYYAWPFLHDLPLPFELGPILAAALPIFLFLTLLRVLPLSGTHGAEHMVVHAIERGEELTPETVRRMPRVHPRCGTNLAVGLSVFLALATGSLIADQHLRLLAALLITAMVWRPLGSFMQYYVTTSRPNDRQIASGIRAGQELLEKYARSPVAVPGIFRRILNSGLLHVVAGSMLLFFALWAFSAITGLHIPMITD
jgi:CBS domain-containing protein